MDKLSYTLIGELAKMQLAPGVTFDEVRKRFLFLANVLHPDRHAHNPKVQAQAEADFKVVAAAFEFVRTYQHVLPSLAVYAGYGPFTPPWNKNNSGSTTQGQTQGQNPPPPPPPSPFSSQQATSQSQPSAGSQSTPFQNSCARIAALTAALRKRLVVVLPNWGRHNPEAFILTITIAVMLMVVMVAVSAKASKPSSVAASYSPVPPQVNQPRVPKEVESSPPEPRPLPKPMPPPQPPPPPLFESVEPSANTLYDIARLVGVSDSLIDSSVDKVLSQTVDINDDDKSELLVTNVDGTCRSLGCPVYLVRNVRGKLRDVLPNNYGWTSVTLLRRKTLGARDIIVTMSDWNEAARSAPASRKCWRLVWQGQSGVYDFADELPPEELCYEAEKRAWNIAEGLGQAHQETHEHPWTRGGRIPSGR